MATGRQEWRNLAAGAPRPTRGENLLEPLGEDPKNIWKPLRVRGDLPADPDAEFMPYAEEDVVPAHEHRPTFAKRDRLHRMAEDLLNWDTNDIFYFRAKVDLAALAFRDYDPDDKKRNLVRYMQLNILWQWPLRNEQDDDELRGPRADRRGQYALFKYRFRMGNHKLRMLAVPSGPSTRFDMRWTWRPTEHLHFTFVTHPATRDTESPLGYKTYFRKAPHVLNTLRQHSEVIVNYGRPTFRLALSHEFSQNCSSISYLHHVHPRLVLGVEARYPRKLRLPHPVGFVKPQPILTAIIRYFSWDHLFQLVTEFSRQYGAVQLRASYVKDLSALPSMHVFPKYERFMVGGCLWSNIYPSSILGVYRGSYLAMGYSYTNYWTGYNLRSTIDSEWNMKTEMSTGWLANLDITLQLTVGGWYPLDDKYAPLPSHKRLGWALGFTWYT